MARYVVAVKSPKSVDDAFVYMADLRNFADWDPGVKQVVQVDGVGGGASSSFDVTVKGFPNDITLRYVTTEYEPAVRLVARAKSSLFTSIDTITVESAGSGSIVTYDAHLKLNGVFGLADPALGLAFKRIGDRAAAGLVRVLDGERHVGAHR
jgi:hypothetical protein